MADGLTTADPTMPKTSGGGASSSSLPPTVATATEPDVVMQLLAVASSGQENAGKRKRKGLPAVRWTPTEEDRLRILVDEIGERGWSTIAERLGSSRSATAVEQHWQIMVGRRRKATPKTLKATPSSATTDAAPAATLNED